MKPEYFTEYGINQVIKKYEILIGREFYFDENGTKHKLLDIIKAVTKYKDAFLVLFQSEKYVYINIHEFMRLNKLEYSFHAFETATVEEAG